MGTKRNEALEAWMTEHGYSSNTLADAVNRVVGEFTGKVGGIYGANVRDWKAGRVTWPKTASRMALEHLSGRSATDLGFVPRGRCSSRPAMSPEESPLRRRTFVNASTGVALATPTIGARPTVGNSDVQRLRERLAALYVLDDQKGGGPELEERATRLCRETEELQRNGSATSRVRSRLYALAATFTATAMWAAVDSRRLEQAQRHMEKAIALAGLSGDGQVQHQIWRFASMLAGQRERWVDAVAASEAAMKTSVHRRDRLYASLSHARLAVSLPGTGDRARTLRALAHAREEFCRAGDGLWRPVSMDFYTTSELEGLTGVTYLRLREPEKAEYHLHRSICELRPDQHRNRAYYTVHLAFAQLAQGDAEQACATASSVALPRGSTPSGRIPHLLANFTRDLNRLAPRSAITVDWGNRFAH